MRETPPADVERYLRALRQALAALPRDERDDVVAEVRSHLAERAERTGGDVLAGFAPPEEYASEFLAERALAGAIAGGSSWALGAALLSGARTGAALLAVVPLAILHLFGVVLVVLAALRPFFPGHVGVFVGAHGSRVIGAWGGGPAGELHDVLGAFTLPVFAAAGTLLFWGANRALRALARTRLARVRQQA